MQIFLTGPIKKPTGIALPDTPPPLGPVKQSPVFNRGEDVVFVIKPGAAGRYVMTLKARDFAYGLSLTKEFFVDRPGQEVTLPLPGANTAQMPSDTYFYDVFFYGDLPQGSVTQLAFSGDFFLRDNTAHPSGNTMPSPSGSGYVWDGGWV